VPARRPVLLTIVGWLTLLVGLLEVFAGVLVLIFKDNVLNETAQLTSDEVTAFAIAAIVIGLIYFFVGRGFLRLSGFALGLGLVVSTLAIVGNVLYMVSDDGDQAGIVFSLILNVIVLIACVSGFNARSRLPAR
jgi:hypothetical protein